MKFKVWDEINATEPKTATMLAVDAETVAELYAEHDCDGQADDIYSNGHNICVRSESGVLSVFKVRVDYDPTFSAELVSMKEVLP